MPRKRRYPRGGEPGCLTAKLTVDDVVRIRRAAARGERLVLLAYYFEVSVVQIRNIVSGKAWRHVPMVPERPFTVGR